MRTRREGRSLSRDMERQRAKLGLWVGSRLQSVISKALLTQNSIMKNSFLWLETLSPVKMEIPVNHIWLGSSYPYLRTHCDEVWGKIWKKRVEGWGAVAKGGRTLSRASCELQPLDKSSQFDLLSFEKTAQNEDRPLIFYSFPRLPCREASWLTLT